MRTLKPVLVIAVLAALAIAAGCGGDDALSTAEYEQELDAIFTPIGPQIQEALSAVQSPQSTQDLASSLGDVEDQLQSGIDQLSALEPPEEVVDAHERLISGFESIQTALTDLREAAESGDQQEVADVVTNLPAELSESQTTINEALTEFEDAGVSLGGSSGEGG